MAHFLNINVLLRIFLSLFIAHGSYCSMLYFRCNVSGKLCYQACTGPIKPVEQYGLTLVSQILCTMLLLFLPYMFDEMEKYSYIVFLCWEF